jgi:hypothetical protein
MVGGRLLFLYQAAAGKSWAHGYAADVTRQVINRWEDGELQTTYTVWAS